MEKEVKEFMAKNTRSKCPSCGAPNKCALEEGKSITACWCYGEKVKPEQDLKACLCRVCFNKLD